MSSRNPASPYDAPMKYYPKLEAVMPTSGLVGGERFVVEDDDQESLGRGQEAQEESRAFDDDAADPIQSDNDEPQPAAKKSKRVASLDEVKAYVKVVHSLDWMHSPQADDLNPEWIAKSNDSRYIKCSVVKPRKGRGLGHLFPERFLEQIPSNVFTVLVVMAESFSKESDPRRPSTLVEHFLYFGPADALNSAMSSQPYQTVANYIRNTTTEHKKWDLIVLGFGQSYAMTSMVTDALDPNGLLVVEGRTGTSRHSGGSKFVVNDIGEHIVEHMKESYDKLLTEKPEFFQQLNLHAVDIVRDLYEKVGSSWLGPSSHKHKQNDNEEYVYSEFWLDCSIEEAKKRPNYLDDYICAFDMRIFSKRQIDIVNDEFKASRRDFFDKLQKKIDAQHAQSDAGAAGR